MMMFVPDQPLLETNHPSTGSIKKSVSDSAGRIDNILTADRTTADFEATLEVNTYGHFSQNRNS